VGSVPALSRSLEPARLRPPLRAAEAGSHSRVTQSPNEWCAFRETSQPLSVGVARGPVPSRPVSFSCSVRRVATAAEMGIEMEKKELDAESITTVTVKDYPPSEAYTAEPPPVSALTVQLRFGFVR